MPGNVNLSFSLLGRDVSASKALGDVGEKAAHTGTAISHHIGVGAIAAGAALGSLAAGGISMAIGAMGGLIADAQAGEAAQRITAQVIKTTGGAAHVTAGQVDDLATAISNKTGVDDDQIRSGENMLLTFTNVRNEVGKGNDIFNRATQTVTDMSVALGQDTKSSAIQLGKALNDPIKGVTALQRVGVSFTESQKKQIAQLVKHGDVLGAQKIILKELGTEFGGAAAASSDPMQKLGTILGNLGKEIAANLLPIINRLANWLISTGIPAFRSLMTWMGTNLGPVIQRLGQWFTQTLWPAMQKVGQWIIANLVPVFQKVAGFITGTVVPAVQGLASQFMTNIWPAIQKVGGMIASNLQPVIEALGNFWRDTLLPNIIKLAPILGRIAQVIGIVVGAFAVIVSWIVGKVAPVFFNVLGGAITFIVTALGHVADAVGWVIDHFGMMVTFLSGIKDKLVAFFSPIAEVLTGPFRTAFSAIQTLWNNTIGGFSISIPDLPGTDWGGFNFTIPRMATGGIVTRPTLAMIGEAGPEAVVPLSRGGLGGPTVHIHVNGVVSGSSDAVARELARILRDGIQRGAATPAW